MNQTAPHTVVGKATEVGLPKHMTIDVVVVRGEKPNRVLILHEPYNKPDRVYTRQVETQASDMKIFFQFDGAYFAPDFTTQGWYADSPDRL